MEFGGGFEDIGGDGGCGGEEGWIGVKKVELKCNFGCKDCALS